MDEEASRDSEVSAEKVESSIEVSTSSASSSSTAAAAVVSVSSVPENWKEIDVKNDESSKVVAESATSEGIHLPIHPLTHSLSCLLSHRRKSSWWR